MVDVMQFLREPSGVVVFRLHGPAGPEYSSPPGRTRNAGGPRIGRCCRSYEVRRAVRFAEWRSTFPARLRAGNFSRAILYARTAAVPSWAGRDRSRSTSMLYREFRPSERLSPDVECFWLLEGYDKSESARPERLLPDGCIELIVNLGDRFRECLDDGSEVVQPLRLVAGQMTRPLHVMPTGSVRLFGIRFTPGGTVPFFDCPPAELTNRIVELDAVAGWLEGELARRLDPTLAAEQLVRAAELLLVGRLGRQVDRRGPIRAAVRRMLRTSGRASIDRIADDLGISGRQLERRFAIEVGLGPKLLCRILRFQTVFQAVEQGDLRWAEVAAGCGYYDQSHLIRDFRQFGGDTPASLLADLTQLGEFFTRAHRTSLSSNTRTAHSSRLAPSSTDDRIEATDDSTNLT